MKRVKRKSGTRGLLGALASPVLGFAAGYAAVELWNRYGYLVTGGVHPSVREKLPLAKHLQTIPDVEGNYDLDGASFDSDGVVISGDATKPNEIPLH